MFKAKVIDSILSRANQADHGYIPSISKFLHLDLDAIKTELDIEASAVVRGKQNLPKTDSVSPDEIERSIIKKIERLASNARSDYEGEMKAYEMRIATESFRSRISQIRGAARNAEAEFDSNVQHALLELTQLKIEKNNAEQDLQSFRERHKLAREAALPKLPAPVSYAILMFIFAAETAANAFFFAEKVSGGIAQGFFEAAAFSSMNVLCGFCLGLFGAPRARHRELKTRIVGMLACGVLAASILGNNLLAAHYRSALSDDVDTLAAAVIAYDRLIHHPFLFTDGRSVQLMLFGFLFAFGAAVKGWLMDDPYPDYGRRTRAYQAAVDNFIIAKKDRMDAISSAYSSAVEGMQNDFRFLENGMSGFRTLIENRRRFHQGFMEHLDHLEHSANDLLIAYRQKNEEIRSDEAPSYFSIPFKMPRPQLDEPSTKQEEIEERLNLLKSTGEQIEKISEHLHALRQKAIEDLSRI